MNPRPRLRLARRSFPDLRDAHTPVRLSAYRDLVPPQRRIQARTKSVTAPLVCTNGRNVEVPADFEPVNTLRELAVRARLLDSWAEVRMLQRDAVFVAAGGIDNLPGRDGAVRVNFVLQSGAIHDATLCAMFRRH